MTKFADAETFSVGEHWNALTEQQKLARLHDFLINSDYVNYVKFTRALSQGIVFVELLKALKPNERGSDRKSTRLNSSHRT